MLSIRSFRARRNSESFTSSDQIADASVLVLPLRTGDERRTLDSHSEAEAILLHPVPQVRQLNRLPTFFPLRLLHVHHLPFSTWLNFSSSSPATPFFADFCRALCLYFVPLLQVSVAFHLIRLQRRSRAIQQSVGSSRAIPEKCNRVVKIEFARCVSVSCPHASTRAMREPT